MMDKCGEKFRDKLKVALLKEFEKEDVEKILGIVDKQIYPYELNKRELGLVVGNTRTKEICETYASCMILSGVKENSVKNDCYEIANFFRTLQVPIEQVTPNEIRNYISFYKERVKETTLNRKTGILKKFFEWCVQEEIIEKSPMRNIKTKLVLSEEKKPLSDVERMLMYEACNTDRERAMYKLLESTGCRISEIMKLNIEDVDFGKGEIYIKHAKGDKNRTVFFDQATGVILKRYLDGRKDKCERVFVTRYGLPITTPDSLRRSFEDIAKRAGIDRKITPHITRHTFVTRMLESGTEISVVAQIVGHESIDLTKRVYSHVSNDSIKSEYRKHYAA